MRNVSAVQRPNELGEPPASITYQSPIAWIAPGVFALGAAIGLLWLIAAFVQGGPLWFGAIVFAIGGWNAVNMIGRQARSVVVVNGTLYWTTWFRQEEVALKDVVRLSLAFTGSVQVIECRDGRKLRFAVAQGYRSFIDRLAEAYPDLDIERGAFVRFL